MPRIYCSEPLRAHAAMDLPADAAKHCQVLRLQPEDLLTLFDGLGGEYEASILSMGRQTVRVQVHAHHPMERENKHRVHLIVAMPANERMDWLVEKATELGVHRITPVMSTRSVLRLSGERASKKQSHWRGIALAACAQSARNRIPHIDVPIPLEPCVSRLGVADPDPFWRDSPVVKKLLSTRLLETEGSLQAPPERLASTLTLGQPHHIQVVSGPEGGFSLDEELLLQGLGFEPSSLGPRVLRAETAALVALTLWGNA